jgi:hypothetical protein
LEKAAAMISKMTTWLKNRLSLAGARLQLDTRSSETGLTALMGQKLGQEESAAIAAAIASIERGVSERELRVIHGNELYEKADAQFRHRKRISAIITEIAYECDRSTRREGGPQRQDTHAAILDQARAAAAYLATGPLTGSKDKTLAREILWPWPVDDFRPHDTRRNLVVAGSHVIAAIERIDRAAAIAAREAATAVAEKREVEPVRDPDSGPPGPPPLLFVRNRGMQPQNLINGLGWLIHQHAPVLHIVANSPENMFDVFKKMAALHQDEQISKMFLDLAHGGDVAGKDGEIQPIIVTHHLGPIEPGAPLLLLYPSFETLEWIAEQHGRDAAPWFVLPWDWEEMAGWLEDQEAEEILFE